MKRKVNPVLVVVHCKDCGEYVCTLMVEAGKRQSKLTKQDQHRLAHGAVMGAIEDGSLPREVSFHNLRADIIMPRDGASLKETQKLADKLHVELVRQEHERTQRPVIFTN